MKLAQVGDRIRSKDFINGRVNTRGYIEVGYNVRYPHKVFKRERWHKGDGWYKDVENCVDLSARDETRGEAVFLVISAAYSGEGYGHGSNDYFPPGWEVTAIREDDNLEIIKFYQSGCFDHMVKDIEYL